LVASALESKIINKYSCNRIRGTANLLEDVENCFKMPVGRQGGAAGLEGVALIVGRSSSTDFTVAAMGCSYTGILFITGRQDIDLLLASMFFQNPCNFEISSRA
jgi:hypothetical protein